MLGGARKLLLRIGLASAAAAIALLALELGLRATRRPILRPPSAVSLCRPLDDATGLRYELIPDQVVRHALPSAEGRAREVVYTIDAAGHRGAPVPPAEADSALRIAVVGDSFVFGSLVDDGETLPAQLERALAALGVEARAINLGVPGYQLRQLVEVLETRVVRYAPDVVLLDLYVNDTIPTPLTYDGRADDPDPPPTTSAERWIHRLGLTRPGLRPEGTGETQRLQHRLRRASALADWLAGRLYLALEERVRRAEHVHRWRAGGAGWTAVLAALDRATLLAARDGYELHVSMYPTLPWIAREPYPLADAHARLAAACLERGIAFHDLLPAFAGRDPARLWVHPLDQHPNAAGHALAAELLAGQMAAGVHRK